MTAPSPPAGYDVTKRVLAGRSDCHITVGFDRQRSHIPRFLVQLHYQVAIDPVQWEAIARMDHNETSVWGHDVYKEGLHVDVRRRSGGTVHLQVPNGRVTSSPGTVIRRCVEYLRREAEYCIDVYEERRSPGSPPTWSPDGGESTRTFISTDPVEEDMSREAPAEDDALAPEELSELLAEVEGTTAEEIERGAAEIELGPLEDATVVDK
jgi:hypothetical protein